MITIDEKKHVYVIGQYIILGNEVFPITHLNDAIDYYEIDEQLLFPILDAMAVNAPTDWRSLVQHPHTKVREVAVAIGDCPELFVHDPEPEVRAACVSRGYGVDYYLQNENDPYVQARLKLHGHGLKKTID